MHYITGTSFTIAPNSKILPDRRFKSGNSYTLLHIFKKEEKFKYVFVCLNDRSKLEIEFNSCIEGDRLISKLRREELPNYYKEEESYPDL